MASGVRQGYGGSVLAESASTVSFFSWQNARECAVGAMGIYALCMLGQAIPIISRGVVASPLWPSSGLALAILLLKGWRLFPAIIFGTIASTICFGNHPLFILAGSLGNTLESIIGYFLLTRIFDFSVQMSRLRDLVLIMTVGSTIGPFINALICTFALGSLKLNSASLFTLSSYQTLETFWMGNL